ncbi:hypothetical protein LZC95_49985 [Pendulispora brunnea]|uniref:Uncharacterized protein n=1 Tax=Pendulispora brunnea TaxID=2905690 RepID=A0ABZ2KDT7_9BACT
MNIDTTAVRSVMQGLVRDCVDWRCLEVNYTLLAENAAAELELYEDDPDESIPEEVFELALEVGEAFERELRSAPPHR